MNDPTVRFLIGGAQKTGTSALAYYLSAHPDLELPTSKEAHVFDDPDFAADWDRDRINREYAPHFPEPISGRLRGDATPIYLFHAAAIARIAAYNPEMRWILLLRDPVERAISQYAMERSRGFEPWPLWAALLFERWRLRGHLEDWSAGSPLRHWSYRARGDYARQLRQLHAHFPPGQVLLVRNDELRTNHVAVLARICAFLDIPDFAQDPAPVTVLQGDPMHVPALTRALASWCLRRERREYRQL